MSRSINDILREADDIVAARTSEKTASAAKSTPSYSDEDIFKLAEALTAPEESTINTLTEKVAASIALVDTLLNLDTLIKIAHFEKAAKEKGYSEEKVAEFLEKQASEGAAKFKSVVKMLPWMAGAAGAGGVAGLVHGHKKGKEKGYNQAVNDMYSAAGGAK